jgi:hypothetical protein
MFYSVPLAMAADAKLVEIGVRQLAARIPFEGVAQRDAVRTPFLHREPHLLKKSKQYDG